MVYLKGQSMIILRRTIFLVIVIILSTLCNSQERTSATETLVTTGLNCNDIQFNVTLLNIDPQQPWSISFDTSNSACGKNSTEVASNATIVSLGSIVDLQACSGVTVTNVTQNTTKYTALATVTYGTSSVFQTQDVYDVECTYTTPNFDDIINADGYNASVRQNGYASANATGPTFEDRLSITVTKTLFNLGEYVVATITFNNVSNDMFMVPQKCYASSEDNGQGYYYNLLQNKCPSDETTTFSRGTPIDKNKGILQFEAFRFLNAKTSSIYIACEVLVCLSTTETRCKECGSSKRRRRSIDTDGRELSLARSESFYVVPTEVIVPVKHIKRTKQFKRRRSNTINGVKLFNETLLVALVATLLFLLVVAMVKKQYDDNDLIKKHVVNFQSYASKQSSKDGTLLDI